jgi:hypothetical protein
MPLLSPDKKAYMNFSRTLIATCLLVASFPARSQQMDMDAMMKWGSADVIRYHVVGVYQATPIVSGDGAAIADVSDRVVFDFTWKLSEMKLVGKPTFQNFKTTVAKPRDRDGKCAPPVLKGDFEYYDALGIKDGLSGSLEIQVQTTYPVVDVPQMCTGKPKAVPAKNDVRPEEFVVVSPVSFGMPLPDSDDLRISNDKKSLVAKRDGWTWIYTPSIVPRK